MCRRRDAEGRPSAGIAMVTSIVSVPDRHPGASRRGHDRRGDAARQCVADRRLKEKLLAALGRDHKVLIPVDNVKDLRRSRTM